MQFTGGAACFLSTSRSSERTGDGPGGQEAVIWSVEVADQEEERAVRGASVRLLRRAPAAAGVGADQEEP
jgi:hypothetical protein